MKWRPRIQFQFTLCKNKSFLDGLFEVGGLSPAEVQEQAKEVATDASLGQICVEFGKLVGAVLVPSSMYLVAGHWHFLNSLVYPGLTFQLRVWDETKSTKFGLQCF